MNTVFMGCSNGDRKFAYRLTVISEDQKYIFLNTMQHCRTFAHLTHLNLVEVSSYKSYSIATGTAHFMSFCFQPHCPSVKTYDRFTVT